MAPEQQSQAEKNSKDRSGSKESREKVIDSKFQLHTVVFAVPMLFALFLANSVFEIDGAEPEYFFLGYMVFLIFDVLYLRWRYRK
jgi:hypothetical protein